MFISVSYLGSAFALSQENPIFTREDQAFIRTLIFVTIPCSLVTTLNYYLLACPCILLDASEARKGKRDRAAKLEGEGDRVVLLLLLAAADLCPCASIHFAPTYTTLSLLRHLLHRHMPIYVYPLYLQTSVARQSNSFVLLVDSLL